MNEIDRGRIEKAVREIIEALGEDPEREGLVLLASDEKTAVVCEG